LDGLSNQKELHQSIGQLTSRIVMKYDQESERLGDFFWDYVGNG
jgi:hypothetical protein